VQDRPPACEDADAADGDRGALSPSAHDQARARTQDLSLSAPRHRDHAAEPGVGDGHHLHPDGARLRLFGRGARLVQPPGAVMARIDHHGGGVLRRGVAGCLGASRQAGHLQHRPGFAVHRRGLRRRARRQRRSVKYEEVYLRAYDGVTEARTSIGRYFDFYNGRRPHSSLDDATPDQAYFNPLPLRLAA